MFPDPLTLVRTDGIECVINGLRDIFLTYFEQSTNSALLEYQSLSTISIPLCHQYAHLPQAASRKDNESYHKAQILSQFPKHIIVHSTPVASTVTWSLHSTFFNAMELKFQRKNVQPTNLQQLCDFVISIWNKIFEKYLCLYHEELRQCEGKRRAKARYENVPNKTSGVYCIGYFK